MRNTYKYTKLYFNAEPEFTEGDIFRTIIPLKEAATVTVGSIHQVNTEITTQVSTQVKLPIDKLAALIDFCSIPRNRKEMQEFCDIKTVEYFRKHIIKPMLQNGIIKQTIPDKPNSRNQKYIKA